MVVATLESINGLIIKCQGFAYGIGDTKVLITAKEGMMKITSNELHFEEDNVFLYFSFNPNIKKIKCTFTVTEIDAEYVESLIKKVGLLPTDENIDNYGRDPTLVEKFWNKKFMIKYNELMKYLRKSKIKYSFYEKFKPAYNKNSNGENLEFL